MHRTDATKTAWEETEIPAICENCLGSNPYVRMIRERFGAECKLCTRPFAMFRWLPEKGGKYKRTSICLTCARQRNCCQACMMDLTYGLPLALRDAALKMAGSGLATGEASNAVIKQYIAQNYEGSEDATLDAAKRRALEESDATRKLLQNLATAMPYYKQKITDADPRARIAPDDSAAGKALAIDVGKLASKLPLNGSSKPPADTSIKSLFVMGIEDDLPEHALRSYFGQWGQVSSIVCIHRARCAFVNFADRAGAELAARNACVPAGGSRLVIKGNKLRLGWCKPRSLGTTQQEHIKLGQIIRKAMRARDLKERSARGETRASRGGSEAEVEQVRLPPGQSTESYKTARSGYEA